MVSVIILTVSYSILKLTQHNLTNIRYIKISLCTFFSYYNSYYTYCLTAFTVFYHTPVSNLLNHNKGKYQSITSYNQSTTFGKSIQYEQVCLFVWADEFFRYYSSRNLSLIHP